MMVVPGDDKQDAQRGTRGSVLAETIRKDAEEDKTDG